MRNKIHILIGILAFIVTILVSVIVETFVGPGDGSGFGPIVAIATMGLFIIWSNQVK